MTIERDSLSSATNGDDRKIKEPDDVAVMLRLSQLGWGTKRIARELGCQRNTVKRYLKQGGWQPYGSPSRASKLDGLQDWLAERFKQHGGNADVVRQDLKREHGIDVSLRTVERAVEPFRDELAKLAKATVRFETPPGHQLQIDFGQKRVQIGNEMVKCYLFVATLGYSRRIYAQAFSHERQSAWFAGLEGAFRHFGGVPKEVLFDNAGSLVTSHNKETREVIFNGRLKAFCSYFETTPRACAPFRARTKGKDERGVGYVKSNAIAGHRFNSLEHMNEHLVWWGREVSDVRVHGTTGELPSVRFEREEASALRPVAHKAPFEQIREMARVVATDAFVDYETNRYSVPWRLIGETVTVSVAANTVDVTFAGKTVASHAQSTGRFQVIRCPEHFHGIFRAKTVMASPPDTASSPKPSRPDLLRPLSVYDDIVGGGWQ
jgi:transposase